MCLFHWTWSFLLLLSCLTKAMNTLWGIPKKRSHTEKQPVFSASSYVPKKYFLQFTVFEYRRSAVSGHTSHNNIFVT